MGYVKNSSLDIKQEYFDKMRYYFRQFGLGVQTGIDLPNETAGQIGRKDNQPGFLLDYSIDNMIRIHHFSLHNIFRLSQMEGIE